MWAAVLFYTFDIYRSYALDQTDFCPSFFTLICAETEPLHFLFCLHCFSVRAHTFLRWRSNDDLDGEDKDFNDDIFHEEDCHLRLVVFFVGVKVGGTGWSRSEWEMGNRRIVLSDRRGVEVFLI